MANIIFSLNNKATTVEHQDVYNYKYSYADLDMKPKQQNNKYTIQKSYDVNAIKNSIHNIFTWITGERILDPEFGTSLKFYLYEGITEFNTEKILSEIRKAIARYEPRVKVEKIVDMTTDNNTNDNSIHLEVIYSIPSLYDNSKTGNSAVLFNEPIIVDSAPSL